MCKSVLEGVFISVVYVCVCKYIYAYVCKIRIEIQAFKCKRFMSLNINFPT